MMRGLASGKSGRDKSLTLKITDFGPISSGTITTKPLTILVGPNGCGKSHVATLVYSILEAEFMRQTDSFGMPDRKYLGFSYNRAKHIAAQCTSDSEHVLDLDTYKIFTQYIVNNFYHMLSSMFLVGRKKLIRTGKEHFELDISSEIIDGKIQFPGGKADLKFKERKTKQIKFVLKKNMRHFPKVRIIDDTFEVDVPYYQKLDRQELFTMIWIGMREIIDYRPTKQGIYFPAERGGLTMAQRSLTLHYYNMRGNVRISSPDPNLTSVATDFLETLLIPDSGMGDFAHLAAQFEMKTIRGVVGIRAGPNNMPDIVFIQNNEQFPLNASASSVKDMAAFLLYLKHIAERNDVVILEEPETCLHPTNQILLARLLARLVNEGINIVVTTHSPFFVEQLSNCVVAGENRSGRQGPIPAKERLEKGNVAAYNFAPDGDGYKIEQLEVDDEGIPQYEFTKVYDQLYNELLELERD